MKEELALNGGKPVRERFLPYGQQWIDDDDIKSVINILKSDFITTGPTIKEFEEMVANYVGAKYAVAFSSGTAALHAACYAAGIHKNDEVITTPMTFAATSNAVLYLGGIPKFADIHEQTYNINPANIKPLINEQTKAIIPVDFTGQPAQYEEIMKIAKENNLIVIEDAAHAMGASYNGKKVGTIADMTMFSFHPVKHITTGEGGIITTNHDQYYEKLLYFRNHGISRDPKILREKNQPWYYEMHELGFNYRMTDIQAALGISQMKKLDSFLEKRKIIAEMYTKAFENCEIIIPPYQHSLSESSWHLYVIRLKLEKLRATRTEIFNALQKENIGVNVHYIPVYLHPYYQKLGYSKGLCPIAERVYEEIITLPLFPKMDERDVKDVIRGVEKVLQYFEVKK